MNFAARQVSAPSTDMIRSPGTKSLERSTMKLSSTGSLSISHVTSQTTGLARRTWVKFSAIASLFTWARTTTITLTKACKSSSKT